MKVKVRKWGKSLAIVIPKQFVEQLGLKPSLEVDISVVNDTIEITRPGLPHHTLEELLDGITPGNLHGEYWTGPPVGREFW